MSYPLFDLRGIVFVPLSEAKAKLSEFMRRIASGRERLAVTTNGRPTAVILSYPEYLSLLGQRTAGEEEPLRVISFEDWKKGRKERMAVRDSILRLYDAEALSRKGQKKYKKDTVDGFTSKS